ncbi:MAG: glutamine synthetase beta-grasp domain-containing protein, partial [Thermomicrobiaceae bacterium]
MIDTTTIGATSHMPSGDEILRKCEEEGVEFVNLQFTDVMGIVKSVAIPVEVFPEVIENGQWFDGSSIAGFARIAESDMFLMPDLSTFAVIPWEREKNVTARVICWVHNPNGDIFPGDPRAVLLRQLERAAKLGYKFNTGPEPEFFLLEKDDRGQIISPSPHDSGGYFDLSTDRGTEVRKDMIKALMQM